MTIRRSNIGLVHIALIVPRCPLSGSFPGRVYKLCLNSLLLFASSIPLFENMPQVDLVVRIVPLLLSQFTLRERHRANCLVQIIAGLEVRIKSTSCSELIAACCVLRVT